MFLKGISGFHSSGLLIVLSSSNNKQPLFGPIVFVLDSHKLIRAVRLRLTKGATIEQLSKLNRALMLY